MSRETDNLEASIDKQIQQLEYRDKVVHALTAGDLLGLIKDIHAAEKLHRAGKTKSMIKNQVITGT